MKHMLIIFFGLLLHNIVWSAEDVVESQSVLDLAKRSGCLACHRVEKKVVGPAWKDVSLHYKGNDLAQAALVAKVKKGGKGNWTEVTGGISMPAYSPRVADEDITTLVKFILAIAPD